MADFKDMTVQALRELARKALGRGHSKLRKKSELIEALQAAERKVATAAEKAATRVKEVAGRATRAATEKASAARAGREPAPAGEKRRAERAQAERRRAPGAGSAPRGEPRETAPAPVRVRAARGEPEPDPEGHLVARMAGEEALRGAPHPMTESALEAARGRRASAAVQPQPGPDAFDEQLGELPRGYADDALVAMARDPGSLFVYWDHAEESLARARQDRKHVRAQLWLHAREPDGGWTRVRALDVALESRSYYVHDLEHGRTYRAELHVVDGSAEALLARPSNEVTLPTFGPSPVIDDHFARIPWGEPLRGLLLEARPGGPFSGEARAQLAAFSEWARVARGRGTGRPSSPAPSSPWSAWGGSGEGG